MKGDYILSLQEKCVNDAIDEMRVVGSLTFDQTEMVRRYLNYVYTIGHYRGTKHDKRMRTVLQISNGQVVGRYINTQAAANAMGVHRQSINKVLIGENNSCGGYFWKYEE